MKWLWNFNPLGATSSLLWIKRPILSNWVSNFVRPPLHRMPDMSYSIPDSKKHASMQNVRVRGHWMSMLNKVEVFIGQLGGNMGSRYSPSCAHSAHMVNLATPGTDRIISLMICALLSRVIFTGFVYLCLYLIWKIYMCPIHGIRVPIVCSKWKISTAKGQALHAFGLFLPFISNHLHSLFST